MEKEVKIQEEQSFEQEQMEIDSTIRPGGVFMVQLLMKEYCEMPSKERLEEVLSKYLGRVEQIGDSKIMVGFAAMDYMAKFQDGKELPVQVAVSACEEFHADVIDEFRRSQMWDCDKDRILSECKYDVLANDLLGGALPPFIRANMLMDYLEALVELYPQCEAVNGDTIDGIENGQLIPEIQWRCCYENALVLPKRTVIDVYMNEYAAGERK